MSTPFRATAIGRPNNLNLTAAYVLELEAERDSLLVANKQLREALKQANLILLQQKKYKGAEMTAMDIIQNALAVGKGGLNENQGDWLEHHRHVRPSANCHLCLATPTQEPKS